VKFTPKKGHIHISLKRLNSSALLQVFDSGEGIDPESLPYIFDRFQQADRSYARKHGGLGVGLTIVKYLVEMHGGTIYAESEGVGKGSTFTIKLPIPALASASHRRETAIRNG
jgi:signal transduction histidine kinase